MTNKERININNITKNQAGWLIPTVIAAGIYISAMCRLVYIGDSGEFSLVFSTLGIAHPPGYPLFTVMGRFFLILTGFLKPAFSANLLNAIIAAGIVPALFYIFNGRKHAVTAGILAMLWAVSPSFWGETQGVEVYTLSLLFIAIISAVLLSGHEKKWYISAYILGLALGHHPTVLAVVPGMVMLAIYERKTFGLKKLSALILLTAAGISVYIYLPVRASLEPVANWGNPSDWQAFYAHVTAAMYQQAAEFSWGNFYRSFALFSDLIVSNWSYAGIVLLVCGIAVGIRYYRQRTIFFLLLLVSNLLLAAFYKIPDIDPYYLPGLFAGFCIIGGLAEWIISGQANKMVRYAVAAAGGMAVVLLIAVNYRHLDRSDYTLADDYGKLILDTAGSGAVFTFDDAGSFPAMYLGYAENYRPGVEVFDRACREHDLIETVAKYSGGRDLDFFTAQKYYFSNVPGLKHLLKCHHIYNLDWMADSERMYSNGVLYSTAAGPRGSMIRDYPADYDPGDFKSRQLLANLELSRGEGCLAENPPDSAKALKAFRKGMAFMANEKRGILHNHVGIFFRHFGYSGLALECYDRGLNSVRLSELEQADIVFNISNIYKDMGNLMMSQSDYRGAAEAFAKAIEYDPDNYQLYYNTGMLLTRYLRTPEKGIPYLETYLKFKPDDAQVRGMIESYRQGR